MDFFGFLNGKETFRPIKKVDKSHRGYNDMATIRGTLGLSNYKEAVKVPSGANINNWISMHAIEFYNQLTLFYSVAIEFCTEENCPHMSAGPKFKYLWEDGVHYKKPSDLPAAQYIKLLFDWADAILGDETIFPSDPSAHYPQDFKSQASKIFRRFFRVYAHIYCNHSYHLRDVGGLESFNSSFHHFYCFVKEFSLVPEKEFAPLADVISKLGM